MTTPKEQIYNSFYKEFQDTKELPEGLVNQFLLEAIGDFETNLYPINYNSDEGLFEEELSLAEISLLGKIMYKQYLSRERDRVLKLNNVIGKDISLTSMGASKSEMRQAYDDVKSEIKQRFNELKPSSYS